ncbi:MAG: UTP--glucose-1-phosphate uridylyltransferase [Clostridia bacterium]|nr:UTP--glucose-1-phosphate uridylyltransferase [Clostridia bacterium]
MKIKKAVITAAGLGTRFLPATKVIPKPMLPVYDKPTIQYIMEEIKSAGIEKVAVIVSPDCDIIKEHFSKNHVLEESLINTNKNDLLSVYKDTLSFGDIEFIVQKEANGLAHAVLVAEDFVGNEPFALLMGDEIYLNDGKTPSCLSILIDEYVKTGVSQVNTIDVFGDDVSKYGNLSVMDTADGKLKVLDIIEKPSLEEAFSNYGSVGRYVLSPSIFKYIKDTMPNDGKEVYLTNALRAMAENEGLNACSFGDVRFDIGDKVGYVKANVVYALKNETVKEDLVDWLKNYAKDL